MCPAEFQRCEVVQRISIMRENDGVEDYTFEMQADTTSVAYRVTAEGSGQSTGWKNYVPPAGAPLQGTGLLFAFLCRDDNARCEAFDTPFRVDIFDIAAGWR